MAQTLFLAMPSQANASKVVARRCGPGHGHMELTPPGTLGLGGISNSQCCLCPCLPRPLLPCGRASDLQRQGAKCDREREFEDTSRYQGDRKSEKSPG